MSTNFTIYELNIKIKTNVKDLVDFKRSMLKIPSKQDDESVVTLNYSDIPFFTYDYKYPLNELRKIRYYKQLINIFFNYNEFINYMRTYGVPTNASLEKDEPNTFNYNSTLYKNEIMNENILTMLEVLFPTSVDIANNLHTSYQYLKGQFSTKPFVFNFTPKQYVTMNVDGKDRLIDKVIFYNDLVNHPLYNNAIKEIKDFLNRYEKEENKIYEDKFNTKNTGGAPKKSNTKSNTKSNANTPSDSAAAKKSGEKSYETNFRLNTLTKLKYPNYNINNYYFQTLINVAADLQYNKFKAENISKEFHNLFDKDTITNTSGNRELFYRFIRYLYDRYILSGDVSEVPFYEKMIKGCICDIDLQGIKLKKEIYISVKLHDDKINESNINSQKCDYVNDILGSFLTTEIRPKYLVEDQVVAKSSSSNSSNKRPANSNNSKSNSDKLSKSDIVSITTKLKNSEILKEFFVQNKTTGYDYKFETEKKNIIKEIPNQDNNALKYFVREQNELYEMYGKTLKKLPGVDFIPDEDKIVANIANNKLLPNDIGLDLVSLFAEILRLWIKLSNNTDNLGSVVFKDYLNDYTTKLTITLYGELDKYTRIYETKYAQLKNDNVPEEDPRRYNSKYIIRVLAFYKSFFKHIIDGTINRAPKKRVRFDGGKTKRGGKRNARRTKKIKKNKIK